MKTRNAGGAAKIGNSKAANSNNANPGNANSKAAVPEGAPEKANFKAPGGLKAGPENSPKSNRGGPFGEDEKFLIEYGESLVEGDIRPIIIKNYTERLSDGDIF